MLTGLLGDGIEVEDLVVGKVLHVALSQDGCIVMGEAQLPASGVDECHMRTHPRTGIIGCELIEERYIRSVEELTGTGHDFCFYARRDAVPGRYQGDPVPLSELIDTENVGEQQSAGYKEHN